jgi:hypothetical protein
MGLALNLTGPITDADVTAVALYICHVLQIDHPVPMSRFDDWWIEDEQAYRSYEGNNVYTLSTALHLLEAYLTAPNLTRKEREVVWRRTMRLLNERPWIELYHSSPFYNWKKLVVISVLHADQFQEWPMHAGHDALEQILLCQQPSGAFASASAGGVANREETALGLYALKYACLSPRYDPQRVRIDAAVTKAQKWLVLQKPCGHGGFLPSLWVEKIQIVAPVVIDSLIVAALTEPKIPKLPSTSF